MRLAAEYESLSNEVAMALSRETLDDVEAGRTARYGDVTSDGGPPAEEVLGRLVQVVPEHVDVPGDQQERVATPPRSESNIPCSSTPKAPIAASTTPMAMFNDARQAMAALQMQVEQISCAMPAEVSTLLCMAGPSTSAAAVADLTASATVSS